MGGGQSTVFMHLCEITYFFLFYIKQDKIYFDKFNGFFTLEISF